MDEPLSVIWHGNILRWVIQLNIVWCVNSVAHFYGDKPYDKDISPTDSRLVGFLAMGEGKHGIRVKFHLQF
jgi:stearoyl-CoA desaturase (delta-9 desaturase)